MKTFRILFIGLMLIGLSVQAQKIYIRGGLGIAVGTAGSFIYNYTNKDGTNTTTTSKKCIGTGLPFALAAGYKLNDNIGIELGVDYFYGFWIKSKDEEQNSTFDSKWHGQMLSIVPAFIFTFPLEKFHPYARMGLVVGVMNSVVYKDHETDTSPEKASTLEIDSKSKDYGGIPVGVQSALGTDYALSDKISIFGEIQVTGINYSPKHGKYLEYSENGVDKMGDRTTKQNNWDYVKEVDWSKNIPNDQNDQFPRVSHKFGNVGLVVGVKYNIK